MYIRADTHAHATYFYTALIRFWNFLIYFSFAKDNSRLVKYVGIEIAMKTRYLNLTGNILFI